MADQKFTGQVEFNGKPVNIFDGRLIDNAGDIANNALQDSGDIMAGLGTMASAGMARGFETLPFHDPQHPFGQPLFRTNLLGTAPDLGDVGLAGAMGQGLINQYKQPYVDPILEGRPGDVLKHVLAHPLNTAFDVFPAGKTLGVGRLAGAVSKSEAVTNAMAKTKGIANQALANGVQKAGQAITAAQESSNPFTKAAGDIANAANESISAAKKAAKQFGDASKIQKDFADAMIGEDNQFLSEVGSAWRKIPKAQRASVQAYAEGWHPELLAGRGVPDHIKGYLDVAEKYSAMMRERISGLVDDTAMGLDKYQPATIKLKGFDTKTWQALTDDERTAHLLETQRELERMGINPQYSPHVQDFEMRGITADPTRIKDKLTDKNTAKQLALKHEIDQLKAQALELRNKMTGSADDSALEAEMAKIHAAIKAKMQKQAGYLKAKNTSGNTAIKSHYDALRTRWLQIGQLHNAYEKVLQAAIDKAQDLEWMKNAPDAGAKQIANRHAEEMIAKGLVELDAHDLAKSILGSLPDAVASAEEIEKLITTSFPKTIYLDKNFAAALKLFGQSITPKNNFANKALRWYDEAISISKRYMLGGNLTYAEAQAVQQAGMLELISINGAKDFVLSLCAWKLAFNESVRNAIPAHIAEDIITKEASSKAYLQSSIRHVMDLTNVPDKYKSITANTLGAYDHFVNFNLTRAQMYDSFIRAKAGIFYGLKAAQEDSQMGLALRDMFASQRAVSTLHRVMENPILMSKVDKQVLKACGNFKALSGSPVMRLLGRITPFPSWLVFISQYTASLPIRNPYKWAITEQLGQIAQEYLADPDATSSLKGGVRIAMQGPNGGNMIIKKDAFNPLTSVGDITAYAQQLVAGQGDKRIPSLLVAPLQIAFIAATRLNPLTLQDFKDPRLVTGQFGEQFSPKDVITGRVDRGDAEAQRPMPDVITLAMRQFFGPLERQIETVAEKIYSGGQKSQMTSMFASAPKRDGSTKQIKKSVDWLQLAIEQIVNVTPIEYTSGDKMRDVKGHIQANRALMRAVIRAGLQ